MLLFKLSYLKIVILTIILSAIFENTMPASKIITRKFYQYEQFSLRKPLDFGNRDSKPAIFPSDFKQYLSNHNKGHEDAVGQIEKIWETKGKILLEIGCGNTELTGIFTKSVKEWDIAAFLADIGLKDVNIAHTERNILRLNTFALAEHLDEIQKDKIKTALMFHDITKDNPLENYIPEDEKLSGILRLLVHHLEASEAADMYLKKAGYSDEYIEEAKRIILTHMGPIRGSLEYKGNKVGFMEKLRLEKLALIENALNESNVNKDRKEQLIGYINQLKQGFPKPETHLEKIASDIDMLDLVEGGVLKIVSLRQNDAGFNETLEESFNSVMQSAEDLELNLYTGVAKEVMAYVAQYWHSFASYMQEGDKFKEIDKLPLPAQKVAAFQKCYGQFQQANEEIVPDIIKAGCSI